MGKQSSKTNDEQNMQNNTLLTGWDVFLVDLVGGVAGGEAWGLLGIGIEYKSRTWWQMSNHGKRK